MTDVVAPPAQTEFQKLSSTMLQYVFDLERAVESRFHISAVVSATIVGAVGGFLLRCAL